MKNKKHIPYLFLAASLIGLSFFAYKYQQSQGLLGERDRVKTALDSVLTRQRTLLQIDSVMLTGNYDAAIAAYRGHLDKQETGNKVIPLRIALAEKLQQKEAQANIGNIPSKSIGDSLATPDRIKREVRAQDSLRFLLEKNRIQLQNLKGQLRERTAGQYLQFKTAKGTKLHYVGEVRDGKANGTGIALMDTGSRYEGEWANNERHGKGTFYWPDGERYEGAYKRDKRTGMGSYYWPNGEKYVGQWKNDKRSGMGSFYGKDGGLVTKGMWKNDKLEETRKKSKRP